MQKCFTTSAGWKNDAYDLLLNDGIFINNFGGNIGNSLFNNRLNCFLNCPFSFELIDLINDGDFVFWTPANFLNSLAVPPVFSQTLLKHAEKLIVFGIGIQAEKSISEIEIKSETKRFIRDLAEARATFIPRGSVSRDFLKTNFDVICPVLGCPSVLINDLPSILLCLLNKTQKLFFNKNLSELNFGLSFAGYLGGSEHRDILIDSLANLRFSYVPQTEINLVRKLHGLPYDSNKYNDEIYGIPPKLVNILSAEGDLIFDASLDRLAIKIRNIDFFVTERIHGAMFAISNGIPAVVVCSDIRSEEFCNHLGLPYVKEDFLLNCSVDSLILNFIDLAVSNINNQIVKLTQARSALLDYFRSVGLSFNIV
jgi:hypothetical protein